MNILGQAWQRLLNPLERRIAINWTNFPDGLNSSATTSWKYLEYASLGFRQNPVVFACIDEICRAASAIRIKVDVEGEEIIEEDASPNLKPLFRLLTRPNKYTSMPAFISRWALYMQLAGVSYVQGFGIGTREGFNGERVGKTAPEMRLIRPDKLSIETNNGQITGFKYSGTGDTIKPEDIWYTIYPDPLEEFAGMAPMRAAAETISSHSNAISWNRNILQKGGLPVLVMIIKGILGLSDKKYEEYQERYRTQFGGAKNAGTPMILGGDGVDVKTLSSTAQELDWLGGKQDMMRDICACFGVPSKLLGDPTSSTFNNVIEARRSFYIEKIIPDMRQFVTELTEWIMPRYGQENADIDIDYSHIDALKDDETAKVNRLVAADWKSVNEKREDDGLEPKEGEQYDEPTIFIKSAQPALGMISGASASAFSRRSELLPHVNEKSLYRTEEERAIAWKRVDRRKLRWEAMIEKSSRALLDKSAHIVAAALSEHAAWPYEEIHAIAMDAASDALNRADMAKQIHDEFTTIESALILEFGEAALADLKAKGILFDIENPNIVDFIAQGLADRSRLINETTADELQRIINAGVESGEGAAKIRDRILTEYPDIARGRAMNIARTEVNMASNTATLEAYKQMGVERKEWLSARDARVRETHQALDGQVVGLMDDFVSPSGARGYAPGNLNDPAEDCQCRCVMTPLQAGDKKI
jgi:HK97 family phage portal protein